MLRRLERDCCPPRIRDGNKQRTFWRNTPTSGNPYDVAVAIDQSISPVFRSEWPAQTANPLIVLFYVATKTKPDGDVTPWCAAFVSWCIERVGLESKHSAASQAYLNFGTEVWSVGGNLPGDAIEGDLCVFTNRFDPRRGHIAFFQRVADDKNKRIFVLGGNQTDSIKSSAYAVDGSLRLVKINRIV